MAEDEYTTLRVSRQTRSLLRKAQDGDDVDSTVNRLAKVGSALNEFTSDDGGDE